MMLEEALRSAADELGPLIHGQGWNGEDLVHRIQKIVRTESASMLMDAVVSAMQQIEDAFSMGNCDRVAVEVTRTVQVVNELKRYMVMEVGGEFAQEVGELCESINQQLIQAQKLDREVPLRMAKGMAEQIVWIWRKGVEEYLVEHSHLSALLSPEQTIDSAPLYAGSLGSDVVKH